MTTKILTKFEHDYIEPTELQSEDYEELKRILLNENSIRARLVYVKGKEKLKLGSYVGYVGLSSGTVVEILPKILAEESREEALKFLLTLISGVNLGGYYRILEKGLSFTEGSFQTLVDLFFKIFLEKLYFLLRSNLRREYIRERKITNSLSGKLLLSEKLLKFPHRVDIFILEKDELSPNNILNGVLKFATYQISCITTSQYVKSLAEKILLTFDSFGVSFCNNFTENLKRLKVNRLIRDYENLINFCWFLADHLETVSGNRGRIFWSFLIDMNVLFEDFIAESLRRFCKDWKIETQPSINICQNPDSNLDVSIRPDIVIYADQWKTVAVLDTKWKAGNINKREDIFQIISYLHLLDTKLAVLIYPEVSNNVKINSQDGIVSVCKRGNSQLVSVSVDIFSTFKKLNDINDNTNYLPTLLQIEICKNILGVIKKLLKSTIDKRD